MMWFVAFPAALFFFLNKTIDLFRFSNIGSLQRPLKQFKHLHYGDVYVSDKPIPKCGIDEGLMTFLFLNSYGITKVLSKSLIMEISNLISAKLNLRYQSQWFANTMIKRNVFRPSSMPHEYVSMSLSHKGMKFILCINLASYLTVLICICFQ